MSDDTKLVQCWGCECEVPLVRGMHVEQTDIEDGVYTYPCNASQDQTKAAPEAETLS